MRRVDPARGCAGVRCPGAASAAVARGGAFHTGDLRVSRRRPPAHADPGRASSPLGAVPETVRATTGRSATATAIWADESPSSPSGPRAAQWDASRRPLGGGARPEARSRARRRPGHDVHRPERIRGAIRPGAFLAAGQPALRRGPDVARQPRPRRGPPHRGLHEARARGRPAAARARLHRASLHTLLAEPDFTPPRCCSTCSAKEPFSTCSASSSATLRRRDATAGRRADRDESARPLRDLPRPPPVEGDPASARRSSLRPRDAPRSSLADG